AEGKVLFEKVAKENFIREVFSRTSSDESLRELKSENPYKLKGNTSPEIFTELFESKDQRLFDLFAEWSINGIAQIRNEPSMLFWGKYGEHFLQLTRFPPLSEYRTRVEEARTKL